MGLDSFTNSGWVPNDVGERKCVRVVGDEDRLAVKSSKLRTMWSVEIVDGVKELTEIPPTHEILIEITKVSSDRSAKAKIVNQNGCKQDTDELKGDPADRGRVFDEQREKKAVTLSIINRGSL